MITLTSISVGNRYRKEYGDLEGLKASISSIGLIHPIVLSKDGDHHILVAGGRRLRALAALGVTELHHGTTLDPQRPGFVFEEELSEETRKEAELDENLYRLKTKWYEDVLNIADVHALKKSTTPKWGYQQTAELLGPGYSKSPVAVAVQLAKLIRKGDKEILECDSMSHALALTVKRREEQALAEMNRHIMPRTAVLDEIKGTVIEPSTATDGEAVVPLSSMFLRGDFMEVCPKYARGSFDHIVTDIPYGIDMDNLDTFVNIKDVEKEHEVEANVDMMEPFLQQAFRLVRSGGFCVFFYDLDWHEYLQTTAEAIGWKVQRWPLIAAKTSACRNSAAQYNFTKNYEAVMVLRRDEKTVLRKPQVSSVWTGDFAAERRLYNNPFAKPFDLWKWIYNAIAFQGQKVLDPFCGEMSACRAAANCGLVPYGIEISEKHFNRGLELMKAVYSLIHKSKVKFI